MTAHKRSIEAAYVSDSDLARMLGRSVPWFKKNRPTLEMDGFPKKDGLIGHTLLWDVEAWIAKRRVVADAVEVEHHQQPSGINYDAL